MPLIMKVQYHRVRPVKKTIRETMWYRYGFRFKKAFTHYSIRSRRRILYTCSQEFEEFRWEWWRWKYVLMSMAEDTKRNNENKKRWREQIRAQLSRERKERERRHRQRVSMQNLRHGKSRDQYRNGHHYPQEDQHLASKSQNHTSHSMNPVPTRRRDTGEVFRDGEIAHNVNRFRVSNSKADETTRSLNTRPTGFMERRAGPGDTSDGDFGQRWPEVAPVPYHRRERQGQPRHGQTHADIDERGSDLLFEFTQQTAGPKPPPSPVLVSKSASRVRLSPVLPSQHQTHAYDLSSRSQKPSSRQRVGGTDEPASLHQSVRSQHVPGASTPRPQYVDSYTRGRSRNRQVDESRKLHASPITPSQQAGQPAPSQRVRDDWIEDPWNPTPLVRPFKRRLEGPEQYESSDGRGRRQAVYSDDRFSMSGALPRGSQPYLTHEIHSQRSPRDSNPNTVRVTGARGGATNQFGYDDKAPYAAASGYHSDGYDSPDRHMENNGVHMRRYGFPVTDAHDDSDYDSERDGYEHTHGVSSSLRHRQDIYPKRARVDDYDFRHSDYGSDQEDYYRQPEYGQHAASHHGSSSRSIQGNRRGFNDEDTPSDEDHSQEHTPQLQSFVRDDTELFNWYARFRRGEGKESSMEPDEREKDSRTGRHRASDVTEPVPYGQIRLGAPVTSDISSGRLGTGNDASSRGKGRVQVYTQPPRVPWPVGRPHLHHNSQGQTNEHEGPDARGNTNAKARGYDGSNTQMRPYFVGTYPRPNVAAAQLRSPSPSSQIQGDYNLPHPRLPKCLPSRMEQQAAKYNVQFPTSLQTLSSDTSWRPTQTQTRFGRTVAVPEGAIQFRREIERDRRREGRRDMLKRAVAERKKRQAEWSARKVQEGQPEQDVRGWNGLDM